MTEVGLKEDNTTNRAAWGNKIISYTGDHRWRDKPGKKKSYRRPQMTGQAREEEDDRDNLADQN